MNRYILSINCGSSSLKFNLFKLVGSDRLESFMQGIVEEIGNAANSRLKYDFNGERIFISKPVENHFEALKMIFDEFSKYSIAHKDICAVGHRVVHGGSEYTRSVLIDEKITQKIRELIPIAPLHNAPNLTGIEETRKLLPDIPHIAVFDTAFHSTIPEFAFRYAIPEKWYKKYEVRKYGFHGTSHLYVSRRAARLLNIPYDQFNCITAHLGNGCSITKIIGGKSVDTSMGFTPLQGVIMGTRSGDIDPGLIAHVADNISRDENMSKEEALEHVLKSLNRESGLKALAGTNMMQYIREKAVQGDADAEMVISIYAYRIAQYIGAYLATMPSAHAIVFTAGLGENEGYVRKKILTFLEMFNITVDDEKNAVRKQEIIIGEAAYPRNLKIMVIPTDEEIVIAYDALYLGYLKGNLPEVYPFEQ